MPYMTISEASDHLDISIDTLRRWDKSGIIRADRNTVGHRIFDTAEIQRVNSKRRCREAAAKDHYSVLKANDKTKLTSIDLFAGAGGTASGLENAGFSHQLLSEIDPFAVATLRLNRPNWNVVEGDVANIDFRPFYNKIDLLEGGFPCQAFSYAGKSMGFEDTRGTLFFEFARAVKEVMPKVFVGENVKGLLRHDKGNTLQTMLNALSSITDELGRTYKITYKVVRAQYHDVAQKRERLIIIGVRSDIDTPILLPKERDYIISLWEAIGHCPPSPGQSYPEKKRRILDLVPPGGYWRDLPSDIQKEYLGGSYHLSGGKTGMARRLSWDEPSLTLTCSPAQKQTERCHPEETRPLNIREYARIQSFPDDWQFAGSVAQQYKQIGNAVPSNLAFHIGRAVRAMLEGRVCDEYIKLEKVPNSDIINSEQLPLFNI
jgi:DNA (cytosine-5-)-methyltransferase